MNKIRLFIVDDEKLILEGLKTLLSNFNDLEVIATTGSAADCVEIIKNDKPDIVLMDIKMENNDKKGVELTAELLNIFPDLKIIMLTKFDDIHLTHESINIGAKGYVVKDNTQEIPIAIRQVNKGHQYIAPRIQESINEQFFAKRMAKTNLSNGKNFGLTKRELEVLQHLNSDKSLSEIADQLFISLNTVKTHVSNLFEKTGVRKRSGLVSWGIEHQLI